MPNDQNLEVYLERNFEHHIWTSIMKPKRSFCLWLVTSLQTTLAVKDVVNLGYAKYQGQTLNNGISQWVGMRFAAPPVGDLRFKPAIDPHIEHSVQDATKV
jgi:hypothetical protein